MTFRGGASSQLNEEKGSFSLQFRPGDPLSMSQKLAHISIAIFSIRIRFLDFQLLPLPQITRFVIDAVAVHLFH